MTLKVGLIGAGLMGAPMARKIVEAGHSLIIHNRSSRGLQPIQQLGAAITRSPMKALSESDFTIVMLPDNDTIEQVVFGKEDLSVFKGKTLIMMSTIGPDQSRDFAEVVAREGGEYLEAPVLGSVPDVEARRLTVMAGGTPDTFKKCLPLLEIFGKECHLIGQVGQAAVMKLALNQMIATLTIGFATSLSMVQAHDLDVSQFMNILRQSAVYAPTFDTKLVRMIERKFKDPNFPTKHLLKDVDLVLSVLREADISSSIVESVRDILHLTIENGFASSDYSAMIDAIHPPENW